MNVLVSVNCITFNQEDMIGDAIESFLAQKTNFAYEILIGEDCSTDNTKKVVESYRDKYPDKIKLIANKQNLGFIGNVRNLHEKSKGKYIAICDGDDYWTDPYKLQKQVDYLEENPECTLCFHAAKVVDNEKEPLGTVVRPSKKNNKYSAGDLVFGGGGFMHSSSMIYPKHLMDTPPDWFFTSSVYDYPLTLILSSHGYAYYIDEFMSAYRMANGSWTTSLLSMKNMNTKKIAINKGDIQILKSFNLYSNLKYKQQVEKEILFREFLILIYDRNLKELKSPKFKKVFNDLGLKRKVKYVLLFCMPNFSAKLSHLYGRIVKAKYNLTN
ncbi:glycosyltransferase [Bacillus sp. FJAT-29814]|uniref:glycosyltransferase family 2 protein n=1 Tax=Bacillus sp. FJAT-29814 TaxID=1729688 RepID=UPI00082D2B12|nr:glycosyltransferase [Bacillus sp. FJAT-29814]